MNTLLETDPAGLQPSLLLWVTSPGPFLSHTQTQALGSFTVTVELGSTEFFIAGCQRGFWRPGLLLACFLALCKFPQSFLPSLHVAPGVYLYSMQHCAGYRGALSSATSQPQALTGRRRSRTTQYCGSRAMIETVVGIQAKHYQSGSPGKFASRDSISLVIGTTSTEWS